MTKHSMEALGASPNRLASSWYLGILEGNEGRKPLSSRRDQEKAKLQKRRFA